MRSLSVSFRVSTFSAMFMMFRHIIDLLLVRCSGIIFYLLRRILASSKYYWLGKRKVKIKYGDVTPDTLTDKRMSKIKVGKIYITITRWTTWTLPWQKVSSPLQVLLAWQTRTVEPRSLNPKLHCSLTLVGKVVKLISLLPFKSVERCPQSTAGKK